MGNNFRKKRHRKKYVTQNDCTKSYGKKISSDIIDRFKLAKFSSNNRRLSPYSMIEICASWHDLNKERGNSNYISENIIEINRARGDIFYGELEYGKNTSDRLSKGLYADEIQNGWFCAGYGPWRRAFFSGIGTRFDGISSTESAKSSRFISLFHEDYSLSAFTDWIIDLEYIILKNPDDIISKKQFELATSVFSRSLPGFKFHSINSQKEIILTDGIIYLTVDQLSDGYKSIASWTGDLLKQLIETYPNSENPTHEEGVVIIDEIDIHLHPKWQRDIVDQTRRIFPNIQFIVTSHSPFVAQDLTQNDILLVTSMSANTIEIVPWTTDLSGWRVDQILTSDLFGLKTTRGERVEEIDEERRILAEKEVRNEITDIEKSRLAHLDNLILQIKSSPGDSESSDLLFDAASIFLEMMKKDKLGQ